ncbi:MAG: protein translocase subunit SecD [Actinobacteria bacterium]|nr:protein translocase subunit SecD [Actinomycetota bacterium]
MTDRRRNRAILALVGALLLLAALVVIPGGPLSKVTKLGLDLRGGTELVYQARPTPKVPKVTPQALDDAINTIQKRTNTLGVSEPEIQRAGANEIDIGLPGVESTRAEQEVGTTAQLQFYDWEPNVYVETGGKVQTLFQLEQSNPQILQSANAIALPRLPLLQAIQLASKLKPQATPSDIPPGGPSKAVSAAFHGNQRLIEQYYDRQNDTAGTKYYLFGPASKGGQRQLISPGEAALGAKSFSQANAASSYYGSCREIAQDYQQTPASKRQRVGTGTVAHPAKGTACPSTLRALDGHGPPPGSIVIEVPRGIVIIKEQAPPKITKGYVAQYYVLEDDSELSGSDIKDPKQEFDPRTSEPIVTFNFTDRGRAAFARATKREASRGQNLIAPGVPDQNKFQNFGISLDNQIVSLANVSYRENPDGISGDTGAEINGIGSIQQTQDLANNLRIGALPVSLKLISKTQVSATLGKQALRQGLIAGAAGLILTLTFLFFFYRFLGLVAGLALLAYAVLLFALVKLIPITLTLPGIAGLILTLGVAADANIVIFERIKEEARSGRSIPAAIAGGYAKGIRTIVDANVVTIGVAFILFMLATAGVKGFAFTLGVGTLVSLFTAVLATSAILGSMARSRLLRSRRAVGIHARERLRWHFDFTGLSRWFFSMSGTIIAAGAIAIAVLGVNLGIDFESGTSIKTPLNRPASVAQVRDSIAPLGYADAKIQSVSDPELGPHVIQIRVHKLDPSQVTNVQRALDRRFGVHDFSSQSIGPTFGQQIARTALIAIVASLILISIYIGLRFEFKFAVPVLIALAHDLLITAGVYALTKREVTTSTVAALLTILGYSLYDTIIVFDRIRENVPRMPRATFSQIVNRSMSEVLTRSLVTSFSTLMPIAALMLFGGATLKDFGFALLVGVASGTYSSIFIASPVLTHWKEREPGYRRRRQLVMADHGGVVPPFSETRLGDDDTEPERGPSRQERIGARAATSRRARRRRAAGDGAPATGAVAAPPEQPAPPAAPPSEPAPPAVPPEPSEAVPTGVPGGMPAAPPGGAAPEGAGDAGSARERAAARAAARRRSSPAPGPTSPTAGDGAARQGTGDGGDGAGEAAPDSKRRNRRQRKRHGRR